MFSGRIRQATEEDMRFLRAMLYEAAYWRPGVERPSLEIGLARPELAKLLKDWNHRPGDMGVIAISEESVPVGAAWYRFWSEDEHSYGFVNENTPEIGIGVAKEFRGRGIGSALLGALIEQARQERVSALSLSVEQENSARYLYEKLGFEPVATEANSLTMVLALCGDEIGV